MKKLWVVSFIVIIAGCAKTNEDLAKDLIHERLKDSLPNFSSYESVNYGNIGKAFLSFEETDQYQQHTKVIRNFMDSITGFTAAPTGLPAGGSKGAMPARKMQLEDSVKQRRALISEARSAYIPIQLFKLTHSYKVKDKEGKEIRSEAAFYFDKDFKKIIKVTKIS